MSVAKTDILILTHNDVNFSKIVPNPILLSMAKRRYWMAILYQMTSGALIQDFPKGGVETRDTKCGGRGPLQVRYEKRGGGGVGAVRFNEKRRGGGGGGGGVLSGASGPIQKAGRGAA